MRVKNVRPAEIPEFQQNQRLSEAVESFEGLILNELLKECWPEGEESSSEVMKSFGLEAISQSIARSGGLGLQSLLASTFHYQVNGTNDLPRSKRVT
jgi:Rod binding domain-containing protein